MMSFAVTQISDTELLTQMCDSELAYPSTGLVPNESMKRNTVSYLRKRREHEHLKWPSPSARV
jgi:hypothetical protein